VDEQFSDDRTKVTIVIAVNEGPVYKVGTAEIRGGDNYPGGAAALQELVRVEPGVRRRQSKVSQTVTAIESAYREEGFFAVRVTAEESLPAEGTTVDLVFAIEEQAKVRVRKLDILGNTITKDKVVRREISLFPDGILNQNEIDKSLNRLRSLGYFQRVTVAVKDVPEGEDPTKKDVVFEVDDSARTGQVRFAAGISSDLGFIGSVSVTKRNFDWQDWPESFGDVFNGRAFSGGGQTFALELAPGSEFSNYRLAFTEPWLFDQPVSFGWDLFFSKFERFDYDVDRRGLNLSLGKRWTYTGKQSDTVLGLTGTTRLEEHDVSNIDPDSSPVAFLSEGDNTLFSQRLVLRADTLDNSLEPSSGWFAQFAGEFGFGGDVQLWKTELEGRHYWIVHRDAEEREHVFSFRARFGTTEELSGSSEADPNLFDEDFVPIYERFTGGGSNSVRGFEFGGVGPHGEGDPFLLRASERGRPRARDTRLAETVLSTLDNDGDPLGGDIVFTTSAEYSFPVYEDILKMVVFVDAGLVRDSFDSVHGLDEDRVNALRRRLLSQGSRQRLLAGQIDFDDGPSFPGDLRIAAGFGLRVKIPFLGQQPIAIDFGFPVSKEDGDDTQVVSFSIARDF
jgi:outer membrane protein insertion porin family